jgi:predicted acyl esterase
MRWVLKWESNACEINLSLLPQINSLENQQNETKNDQQENHQQKNHQQENHQQENHQQENHQQEKTKKHTKKEENKEKSEKMDFEIRGAGMYMLTSFFNHSCQPNVERLNFRDSKALLYSIQQIEAGEELSFSYFDLDLLNSFSFLERSEYIQTARGFPIFFFFFFLIFFF